MNNVTRLRNGQPLPTSDLVAAMRSIGVRDRLIARSVGSTPRAVGHWARGGGQPSLEHQERMEDLRLLSKYLLEKYDDPDIVRASLLLRVGEVEPGDKLPPSQAELLSRGKLDRVLTNLENAMNPTPGAHRV